MPKFKNVTSDDRRTFLGDRQVIVKAGDTLDVPPDLVEGFAGQDEVWEPVGTHAKHAVKEALEDPEAK